MRPDEHKKKKNAAYKKKHGIASDKSSSETGSSVSSVKVDKKNVDKKDRKNPQPPIPALKDRSKSQAVPVSSDDDSSDPDDTQKKTPRRKQFSRREIVSNWQKYEMETEEEEKVKAKGEKYEVILGMAGEAMSRFRFRDELEWEDGPNNGDAIVNGEQQNHLQLNATDLIQSLSCIPVHQLLGVDEELIPKDQLESFHRTASMNQAIYSPREATDSKENQSVPLTTKVHNSNSDETIVHMDSNHHEKEVKSVSSKTHSSSYEIDHTSERNVSSSRASRNAEDSECGDKNPSEINAPKFNQALGLQDDDLDRLLDMDLDMKGTAMSDSCTPQTASADGTDSVQAVSKMEKEESENLEEWLDSILD